MNVEILLLLAGLIGAVLVELVYSIRQQAYIWQLKGQVEKLTAKMERLQDIAAVKSLLTDS